MGTTKNRIIPILATIVAACGEPTQAVFTADDLAISPTRFLSGSGELRVTSRAFRDLELFPLMGPTGFFDVPNMWSNFRVIVANDTLETWRTDDTTISVAAPSVFTGNHVLTIEFDDKSIPATVEVVGQRERTYWAQLGPYNDTQEAYPIDARRAVVYSPRNAGVRIIDMATGSVEAPDARLDYASFSGPESRVPGASYRSGHAVLNLQDTTDSPRVWQLSPEIEPLGTIDCYNPNPRYIDMAETGPGRCLGVWRDSGQAASIHANGLTQITPPDCFLEDAFFVLSPGGDYSVPLTRAFEQEGWCDGLSQWYVFDAAPSVIFSTDRYSQVPGAVFSPAGDVLYIVADRQRGRSNVWLLEALDPSSGAVLDSVAFEGIAQLETVHADPVRPFLYVVGRIDSYQMFMTVVDRGTLNILGTMTTNSDFWANANHGVIGFGGAQGAIYFLGWCGWDCDLNITTFDLDYDLFESLRIPNSSMAMAGGK